MSKVFSTLFLISLLAYFVFATIEEFIEGFVSSYFNVHLLLVPVLIFLILMLSRERNGLKAQESRDPRGSILLIIGAAFATLILLGLGAKELPLLWRILVAVYGAAAVAGILSVLFKE
ncbi:hypothetical protein HY477_02170 [Candidatus Uhrbacteria bacterium]|nr:hypothetical protein [Candidatus Uhrbacteria bacterium]